MAGSPGSGSRLLDRIEGSMVGAVIGDCLGSPVECKHWQGIPAKKVVERFRKYTEGSKAKNYYKYTDDTAMARQVALNLIEHRGLDVPNLAARFVQEYESEPWRGYGGSVCEVFRKLAEDPEDVFAPAAEQFDGQGSYGNGAAMRVHPVGLAASNIEEAVNMAAEQAKLTHSHVEGVTGGEIQAAAVFIALHGISGDEMKAQLIQLSNNKGDFQTQLPHAFETEKSVEEALPLLSNDIAAARSMPTALFSFLKAEGQVAGLCKSNSFQRTLEVAMMFGGDSDTIMSMAGALAGAKYGLSSIPETLKIISEGHEEAEHQAQQLFDKFHQK